MGDAVRLCNISHKYGKETILDGLDFSLEEGGFVCIMGRSGCGKSTLLRLIAGIEKPGFGEVYADSRLAISFQEPRLVPWLSVEKNVCLGMEGLSRKTAEEAARAALAGVGLAEKARAWPLTLSGGQAQRVSLARALVRRPRLVLLDEPFGSLDAFTRREMQDLLASLVREYGLSIIMVTHDREEARRFTDTVLVLENGKLRGESTH
ncbi:MAG: ABC transporter ATP-binding protein [Treponema sp.]|jgi:sulfonate transport system ATP-binding protein|nr:ABC transporter ATP-binding protein [Treponema sp.]